MTSRPFRFSVNDANVADLRARLANVRMAPTTPDPDGRMGADPAHIARLAAKFAAFDWDAFADRVNALPNFQTDYEGGTLHFIHARSPNPNAMPLLLMHGWPGSFLEFLDLIPQFTHGTPAFHVVAPSLPGYGFSTRTLDRPWTPKDIAGVFAKLMKDLGYEKFLAQGGDWGSTTATELGRHHSESCYGVHLNLLPVAPPPESDPAYSRMTEEESGWLESNRRLVADGMGYQGIQGTRPQTLAAALSDSPYGLLTWIAEKCVAWSDKDAAGASLVPDDKIVENVALYWITNSIASSVRLYYDVRHWSRDQVYASAPTCAAIFPAEIAKLPRAWAEYRYNIVRWSRLPRGGHFASWEVPDIFVKDVREFSIQLGNIG